MEHLKLLFTKDGVQYQLFRQKSVIKEEDFICSEEDPAEFCTDRLSQILSAKNFSKISVISALNHFTMMPEGFSKHEEGFGLIAYNAPVEPKEEELMLAVNKKFGVQFYYAFPKNYYHPIKNLGLPTTFNFSGEEFLSRISAKNQKEIHINLYHHQCEFFALDRRKVILYNNLDVNSEVDFLYFIMFTLGKIGFAADETQFFVYGETTENETFISELRKFVKKLKINFDNIPTKNFILR